MVLLWLHLKVLYITQVLTVKKEINTGLYEGRWKRPSLRSSVFTPVLRGRHSPAILLRMSFLSAYVSFWTSIDRVGRYVYFLTAVSFSSVIRSHNSARTHLMVELLCTIYPAAWASLVYLTILPLRDIKAILP